MLQGRYCVKSSCGVTQPGQIDGRQAVSAPGMCLAVWPDMPNSAPPIQEPSLPELVRSIYDQAQVFAKAELELFKLESKSVLTKAAVALVVVIGSGLLLAIGLSLVAAAIVLLRGGSPAAALLTAAGVDVLVSALGVTAMMIVLKKRVQTAASAVASTTQLTNMPQHGSTVS